MSGYPIPSIVWHHNNTLIAPNEDVLIDSSIVQHPRLTICSSVVVSSSDFTDSGPYTCKGVNSAGSIIHSPATVIVEGI